MVKLQEMKGMASGGRVPLDRLPTEFVGTLVSEDIREDRQGRQCIYWNIELAEPIDDATTLTQKFSPMHIDELVKALSALGIEDTSELKGKRIRFRQRLFRIGNPRWMPIEILG